MAKGHGKFICAALIGAAVGCGLAYLNKCRKEESWDEDFDDFQDEDPEDEKEATASREYVTIPKEAAEAVKDAAQDVAKTTVDAAKNVKEDLADAAKDVKDGAVDVAKKTADAVSETVEKMQGETKKEN